MYKFGKVYHGNSIIQFWVSYLLVLIIPLFIVFCGFQYVFHVVKEDTKTTNSMMLEHSVSLLDNDISALESMALQASQNSHLRELGTLTKKNAEYSLLALDVIKEFNLLLHYQGVNILEEAYIYLNELEYVIYDSTIYRMDVFESQIKSWGMTSKEWENICSNGGSTVPRYVPAKDDSLLYVIPIGNTLKGDILGSIVFRIDNTKLKEFFDFSSKYGQYAIFILDNENQMIWSDNSLGFQLLTNTFDTSISSSIEAEGNRITSVESKENDWKYVIVLPEKEVLRQLTVIKVIISLLLVVAIMIGGVGSFVLAMKAGKPINNMFNNFKENENMPRNSANLGELVQEIVKKNEKYMEELEQDKPLLQNAFFHDLIKAEVVSTTEIDYLAGKAGITLSGNHYRVVALKLFANNDIYDLDVQTIEEVRILMNVVKDYLENIVDGPIWFYKRNSLTTLIIFSGNDELSTVKNIVERTCDWIHSLYLVETQWGISNVTSDLLNVWKISEEAVTALNRCDAQLHIVEYTSDIEESNKFYLPTIAEEKLKTSIQLGDMNGIKTILEILKYENFEIRKLNRGKFIKFNTCIVEMLSQFSEIVNDLDTQVLWLNEMIFQFKEGMEEAYFERLKQVCEHLCREISQKKTDKRGKLIKDIMKFIDVNYMDSNLGLAKISTEFGISEGYVSSMFKEQAGVNFAEYVEKLRIEHACQLLTQEKYKILEISEMVGYNSVQSFRRAFKRVLGIQPKEYRG